MKSAARAGQHVAARIEYSKWQVPHLEGGRACSSRLGFIMWLVRTYLASCIPKDCDSMEGFVIPMETRCVNPSNTELKYESLEAKLTHELWETSFLDTDVQ